jgi:SAM-dependent methyltransferase
MGEHVVQIDSYVKIGQEQSIPFDSYEGLPIFAKTGLHAHIGNMVRQYVKPGGLILDLGAGSGAMSLRLSKAGYQLVASDLAEGNFRLPTVEFRTADLNLDFASKFQQRFDAIIAMELIEHVENARHLLRECKRLLTSDGLLFLTTPNTACAVSLAFQMRLGHSMWFSHQDYKDVGHINPLTSWHFEVMTREAGLQIEYLDSFGDPFALVRGWPKMKFLAKLIKLLSAPTAHQGEILVMVCRVA